MNSKLPNTYDPAKVEKKSYAKWRDAGYFQPNEAAGLTPFTIVMPPPNVTGQLHLGHALDNTLQDILSRWRRMQGYSVLWLPGTDHAGIATQAKVEESLRAGGTSREDLGREAFLTKVWEWKELYGGKITEQLSLLGSSCDWSRERFTMDEGCSRAVREVFVNLYQAGLIYQGNYLVNWCPSCHTAISDIEVEHEDSDGFLWHIKYPVEGSDAFIVVATTRPETMLGDTGVAVHPEDERYRDLIGKKVVLPLTGRSIAVFADEYVDPAFGTGAVKVTPAHDPNDYEMGLRHGLEQIRVIDTKGIMSSEAGAYAGMDRYACREQLVEDLKKAGLLLNNEPHRHAVGHCQRCHTVIEPMISKQWFVRMKTLAEPAMEAVRQGEIQFVPERFTKIYLNWMENIRDWCISRQLWWGHRIPVWYCKACGEVICAKEDPAVCPQCGLAQLTQDEDVLDTWFSSALWPFSTLGWPENTEDLNRFYPTSVLVTGRDIIFFWVARMIFSGLYHTGKPPFHTVNIHGLILDGQGRKMSKSLGNGIDPIEVIDQYGADTLRFALITGVTPGNDIRFNWEKIENTKNFANKVWNASRFVLMHLDDFTPVTLHPAKLSLADRWILSRYQERIKEITRSLEAFDYGEAAKSAYEFIWDEFCDWYIELAKPVLFQAPAETKQVVQTILAEVLTGILKLLHPFMPFITEEIYEKLPGSEASIMLEAWPEADPVWNNSDALEQMASVMEIIRAIRNLRAEAGVAPGQKIKVILAVEQAEKKERIEEAVNYIKSLAGVSELTVGEKMEQAPPQSSSALLGYVDIYLLLEGLIDVEKETARLLKELAKAEKDLAAAEGKLKNEQFIAKAPPEVIEKEKQKIAEALGKKEGLCQRLQTLKPM